MSIGTKNGYDMVLYALLMSRLLAGANVSLDGEDLVHCGVVSSDVEDTLHDELGCSDSELAVPRNQDDAMNRLFEGRDPVGAL